MGCHRLPFRDGSLDIGEQHLPWLPEGALLPPAHSTLSLLPDINLGNHKVQETDPGYRSRTLSALTPLAHTASLAGFHVYACTLVYTQAEAHFHSRRKRSLCILSIMSRLAKVREIQLVTAGIFKATSIDAEESGYGLPCLYSLFVETVRRFSALTDVASRCVGQRGNTKRLKNTQSP